MGAEGFRTEGIHHWADIAALVGYVAITMGIGIWAIIKPNKGSVKGYFLAGGSASWWQIGFSLFASNVGSEHFIGMAGAGASSGVAIALIEWNAIFVILLLAWCFLPVYLVSGVYTLPEYLMRRFGRDRLRLMVSIMFVLSTIFVPADLYSGGIFFQQAMGWNIYAGVGVIVLLSAIYSVFGGLLTVIYTDVIQVLIMVIGSIILSIIAFIEVGGLSALREKYMNIHLLYNNVDNGTGAYSNSTTQMVVLPPRQDAWHLFRDPVNADFPSIAIFLRMSICAVFYWCAQQTIVQRALAAKDIGHAKGGALLAGFLKITPMFFIVLPGMISYVLYPEEVGCADPEICQQVCGSSAGCSNIAFPRLVLGILPPGLRGLMVAVMLSASVSSLTSIYNSIATVTALDLWTRIRPRASEKELVLIGRLAVLVVMATSIAWIPIMQNADGGQLISYITAVFGYLGSPLSASFLVSMFWTKCTEQGVFWGFTISGLSGAIRFILDTVYKRPALGQPDTRPWIVSKVHPYYFTAIQVATGIIISVVISLFTQPPSRKQIAGLTFWTVNDDAINGEECTEMNRRVEIVEGRQNGDLDPEKLHVTKVDDIETTEEDPKSPSNGCLMALKSTFTLTSGKASVAIREPLKVRLGKLNVKKNVKWILNSCAIVLIVTYIGLCVYFR